jgi:hypothetical protein
MTSNLEKYKDDLEKLIALGTKMEIDLQISFAEQNNQKLSDGIAGFLLRLVSRWASHT